MGRIQNRIPNPAWCSGSGKKSEHAQIRIPNALKIDHSKPLFKAKAVLFR
jgi:hypothetical protein